MNEKAKLDEARHFYSQMSANFNDRQKFNYNLSAFLSSARSVLQYTLEEVKGKKGGQAWYDKRISSSSILQFFKDKRDINIHSEPIHPNQNVTVVAKVKIGIRVSASVVVRDANGNIKYQSPIETNHPEIKSHSLEEPAQVTVKYVFSDWSGDEDILTLCQRYIDELDSVLQEGIKKGFLMG